MPCYKPIKAWKPLEGGAILFSEKKNCREIAIKCGQCIGCRIAKREAWAIRCYAESKMHSVSHFATITYDDLHLPADQSLDYKHIQLFNRYIRRKLGEFRFFVCGEYGDKTKRPHYHALWFGLDIPDLVKCNSVYSRHDIYESETINRLWGKGGVRIGSVTYESARYCAVYTTKKVSGDLAAQEYGRVNVETGETWQVQPEFARMSLKPGLGLEWLRLYWKDIFVSGADGVPINGSVKPIPRYFMDKLEDIDDDVLQEFKLKQLSKIKPEECSYERLVVRETVAKSRESFNKERKGNHNAL